MRVESYKNVVIRSGEGGKYLAWHLAQSGQKTVVVERRRNGGSCRMQTVSPARTKSGALNRRRPEQWHIAMPQPEMLGASCCTGF